LLYTTGRDGGGPLAVQRGGLVRIGCYHMS
jgi:hypothetical protein